MDSSNTIKTGEEHNEWWFTYKRWWEPLALGRFHHSINIYKSVSCQRNNFCLPELGFRTSRKNPEVSISASLADQTVPQMDRFGSDSEHACCHVWHFTRVQGIWTQVLWLSHHMLLTDPSRLMNWPYVSDPMFVFWVLICHMFTTIYTF